MPNTQSTVRQKTAAGDAERYYATYFGAVFVNTREHPSLDFCY